MGDYQTEVLLQPLLHAGDGSASYLEPVKERTRSKRIPAHGLRRSDIWIFRDHDLKSPQCHDFELLSKPDWEFNEKRCREKRDV